METTVQEKKERGGLSEGSERKATNKVHQADEDRLELMEEIPAVTSGETPYHTPVIQEQVFEETSDADRVDQDLGQVEEDQAGSSGETQMAKRKRKEEPKNLPTGQAAEQKNPKKRGASKDMRIYESFRRIATETLASQGATQTVFPATQWNQELIEESASVRAQAIHSVQSTAVQAMRAIQQIVASKASVKAPPTGQGLFEQPKNRRNRSRNPQPNQQQQAVHNVIWNPLHPAALNRPRKPRQQRQPQQQKAAASNSSAPPTAMEVEPEQAPAGLPDDRAEAEVQDVSLPQSGHFLVQTLDEASDLPSSDRGDGENVMAAQAEDKDASPSNDRLASETPAGR